MLHQRIHCGSRYLQSHYGASPDLSRIVEFLNRLQEQGFRSVEISLSSQAELEQVESNIDPLRSLRENTNFRISYLQTVFPGLSSMDRDSVKTNMSLFARTCALAEKLGASGVIDQAPLPPVHFAGDITPLEAYDPRNILAAQINPRMDWHTHWDNLIDTYRQLCDIAAQHDLTYHLRPRSGSLVSTTDGFLYFQEEIGRSNLRFAMDTATQHANNDNLVLCMLRLHDLIDVVYIADNGGIPGRHLEPGEGTIHWDPLFESLIAVRFRGRVALDIGGPGSGLANIDSAYSIAASMVTSYIDLNHTRAPFSY